MRSGVTTDYVQPVAKAYGDGSPELHSIAKRQQDEIKAEIARLQIQAYTIRQLVALAPAPPVVVQATETAQAVDAAHIEAVTESDGQEQARGLTQEQQRPTRYL